jgi:hypothetical protein
MANLADTRSYSASPVIGVDRSWCAAYDSLPKTRVVDWPDHS